MHNCMPIDINATTWVEKANKINRIQSLFACWSVWSTVIRFTGAQSESMRLPDCAQHEGYPNTLGWVTPSRSVARQGYYTFGAKEAKYVRHGSIRVLRKANLAPELYSLNYKKYQTSCAVTWFFTFWQIFKESRCFDGVWWGVWTILDWHREPGGMTLRYPFE